MNDTPGLGSDHALLLSAIVAGKARWEPFQNSPPTQGEVCVNGLRFSVNLDEYGCPQIGPNVRIELQEAMKKK